VKTRNDLGESVRLSVTATAAMLLYV
jgi:hypothetical protein